MNKILNDGVKSQYLNYYSRYEKFTYNYISNFKKFINIEKNYNNLNCINYYNNLYSLFQIILFLRLLFLQDSEISKNKNLNFSISFMGLFNINYTILNIINSNYYIGNFNLFFNNSLNNSKYYYSYTKYTFRLSPNSKYFSNNSINFNNICRMIFVGCELNILKTDEINDYDNTNYNKIQFIKKISNKNVINDFSDTLIKNNIEFFKKYHVISSSDHIINSNLNFKNIGLDYDIVFKEIKNIVLKDNYINKYLYDLNKKILSKKYNIIPNNLVIYYNKYSTNNNFLTDKMICRYIIFKSKFNFKNNNITLKNLFYDNLFEKKFIKLNLSLKDEIND